MKRGKTDYILPKIEKLAKSQAFTLNDVVELIRPIEKIDLQKLEEQELKRRGRGYIAKIKDSDGVRDIFSTNGGVYVNVAISRKVDLIDKAKRQVNKKYVGVSKSLKKIRKRQKVLTEQITFDFGDNNNS